MSRYQTSALPDGYNSRQPTHNSGPVQSGLSNTDVAPSLAQQPIPQPPWSSQPPSLSGAFGSGHPSAPNSTFHGQPASFQRPPQPPGQLHPVSTRYPLREPDTLSPQHSAQAALQSSVYQLHPEQAITPPQQPRRTPPPPPELQNVSGTRSSHSTRTPPQRRRLSSGSGSHEQRHGRTTWTSPPSSRSPSPPSPFHQTTSTTTTVQHNPSTSSPHRPSQSGAPRLQGTPNGLKYEFIDTVCDAFSLSKDRLAWERKHLERMYVIGQGLSKADHATRMYQLGATLVGNKIYNVNQDLVTKTHAMLEDIIVQLDTNFRLSAEQTLNLRLAAMSLIFNGTRVKFMGLAAEVQRHIRSQEIAPQYRNILGNYAREQVLTKAINKAASHARNDLREDIRDSIIEPTAKTLDEALNAMGIRYKNLPVGASLDARYRPWVALLRRFAYDHRDLLVAAEPEDDEQPENIHNADPSAPHSRSPSVSSSHSQSPSQPLSRSTSLSSQSPSPSPTPDGSARRKRPRNQTITASNKHGRPPKGKDFWSIFEGFLDERRKQYGQPWATAQWTNYLAMVLKDDEARFKPKPKDPNSVYLETPDVTAIYAQYGLGGGPVAMEVDPQDIDPSLLLSTM